VKVVLDSSVLIAAAITRAGVCAELMDDVLTSHDLVLSKFILLEVERKLRTKFHFADTDLRKLLKFLGRTAIIVDPAPIPTDICRDANDRPVLGTAVAGAASLLVTGDKDLLVIGSYAGIAIVRPAEFWHRL